MSITVNFADHSTAGPSGPITAWAWNFGDSGTSSLENPSHSYAAYGTYTVTLVVTGTGGDGTATGTHTVTLTNPAALTSAFVYSISGSTVSFVDESMPGPSGPITGWAWDFGDGGTSSLRNPSHTYTTDGAHTVTLTVTGTSPDGTANASHSVTVKVLNAAFTDTLSGLTAAFHDISTPGPSGPITTWAWNFGDSNTSSSQNPTHTYASSGTRTVTLTVTGTGGDGTDNVSHSVTVSGAALTSRYTFTTSNLLATFTDSSIPGPSGPITSWAWNFGDGNTSSSQNPTHTYSTGGTYTVTLVVTGTTPDGTSTSSHSVAVTAGGGGGGGGGGAFPQILRTSGRFLVDENNHTMARMKGFNVQVVPWAQSDFDAMYANGARCLRTIIFWDSLEPTAGSISSSYISKLDTHLARCTAAGLYTTFGFYFGPNGVHCPGWTGGSSALSNYAAHGQYSTQYLAKRYGDSADPLGAGKYTKSVIGFGINEPTPDSASNTYLATHLSEQHTMMTWFRAYAPNWIGCIACAYGPSAPLPNASGSGETTQTFVAAPNDPFSGIGNWMMEAHCYFEAASPSSRTWDGRNQYGMPNGSVTIKADSSSYPPSGYSRAQCQADLTAFWAPYVQYCGSGHANVPLMVGEWGWKPSLSGGDQYAVDMAAAMANAGAALEMEWDYNTSSGSDPWAARPGGNWQSATTTWITAA